MKKIETIDSSNREWNRLIDRLASRMSGKRTVKHMMNMLAATTPEEQRPSVEYVKAYLKAKWS